MIRTPMEFCLGGAWTPTPYPEVNTNTSWLGWRSPGPPCTVQKMGTPVVSNVRVRFWVCLFAFVLVCGDVRLPPFYSLGVSLPIR